MSNFAKTVLTVLINVLRTLLDDGGDMKISQLISQLDDIVKADGRPYGAGYSCVLLGLPGEIDDVEGMVLSAQERRLVLDGLCLLQIEQKGQSRAHQRNSWATGTASSAFRDLEGDRDATRGLAKRLRDRRDGTARYQS